MNYAAGTFSVFVFLKKPILGTQIKLIYTELLEQMLEVRKDS